MSTQMDHHKFETVGGEFPNTCKHCGCFRSSVQHGVESAAKAYPNLRFAVDGVAAKIDGSIRTRLFEVEACLLTMCACLFPDQVWINSEKAVEKMAAEILALRAELKDAWVDENGTTWHRPTAQAYALTCKALHEREQRIAKLLLALLAEVVCRCCDGTGVMKGQCEGCAEDIPRKECAVCNGLGYWESDPCPECDGTKRSFKSAASKYVVEEMEAEHLISRVLERAK